MVELRIFDEASNVDVTFSHNANFFLYTTLESARAIAPLRGTNVPAPFPVLTGTPVAGMAYLDRPVPAGYFIFPDLSVRHEGKYRLSFNLFEELKEEKDTDVMINPEHPNSKLLRSSPMAPHSHVHFRLEVKSEPFVVFSAKKFPGLAESTALSRVVAEQGCRVRIRRDVRMRRRENKPSKDFDEYNEEGAGYANDRFTTPDTYNHNATMERARSVSASSVDGTVHQYPAIDRRTSSHDSNFYGQAPFQQQAAPLPTPVPQQGLSFNTHLTFGTSQYATPAMHSNIQQQAQSSLQYVQPQQQHQQQQQQQQQQHQPQLPPAHSNHSRHHSTSSIHEMNTQQAFQQQQPQYAPPQPSIPQPRETAVYSSVDNKFMGNNQPYFPYQNPAMVDPRSSNPPHPQQLLPPLKTIQPLHDRTSISSPLTASSPTTAGYDQSAGPYAYPQNQITSNVKRAYDKGFDTSHISSSLTNGARPDGVGVDISQIDADEEGFIDNDHYAKLKVLQYRRADGTTAHKKVTSPI